MKQFIKKYYSIILFTLANLLFISIFVFADYRLIQDYSNVDSQFATANCANIIGLTVCTIAGIVYSIILYHGWKQFIKYSK